MSRFGFGFGFGASFGSGGGGVPLSISRNFTTLKTSFGLYYTIPAIVLAVGDKVRIDFEAPTITPTVTNRIFDNTVSNKAFFGFIGTGFFSSNSSAYESTMLLDGVSVTIGTTLVPTDGKLHTVELTSNATRSIDLLGLHEGALSFDGILANFQVERAATLIRDYPINETWAGASTVLVDNSGNSQDGTAVNIDTDDSELFTFDGSVSPNTWTNVGATRVIEVSGT